MPAETNINEIDVTGPVMTAASTLDTGSYKISASDRFLGGTRILND